MLHAALCLIDAEEESHEGHDHAEGEGHEGEEVDRGEPLMQLDDRNQRDAVALLRHEVKAL